MPYTGPDDEKLPKNVQALPEDKRAQWVEVWNSVFETCMDEDGDGEACEAAALRQANGVVTEETAEVAERFVFIELQADAEDDFTREIEILRTGTFIDRKGLRVEITEEDLDAFVQNFRTGAAGQDIPFDVDHQRHEAVGWLRGLHRVRDRLMGIVGWNALGRQLIADQVYRYLSATVDMARKMIRSISLVNFPAVKGLAPLELSEGVLTYQKKREVRMAEKSEVGLEEIRAQIREEILAELETKRQQLAELKDEIRAEMEVELRAEFERHQEFVKFAEEMTSGDVQLAIKAKDLVALMEQLPDADVDVFKDVLQAKVVAFGEVGSGGEGKPNKKQLPEEYAEQLRSGTLDLSDLRNPVLDLGDLSEYDLSEFEDK